jgi:uncharacterized protein (DUF2126 family)
MDAADPLSEIAAKASAAFARHGAKLTMGGEPTLVPFDPSGPEWTFTALGPTKLRHAYALASALQSGVLANAVDFYCPGKSYPGEVNPRWAVMLVWNRDGTPLVPALAHAEPAPGASLDAAALGEFRGHLLDAMGLDHGWLRAKDPFEPDRGVWALPLDHEGGAFITEDWGLGPELELLRTDGPAGLRLPLQELPPAANRRALTIEVRDDCVHIFLPPLMQPGFLALLEHTALAQRAAGVCRVRLGGYIPADDLGCWMQLGIAADPGVLEINLPPCGHWGEYRWWLQTLENAGLTAGLRSFKQTAPDEQLGTGGGNHLLFGGADLEEHPFFTRPGWVTSILRYWQHHPSLSYLFTGQYVGASSQAPRPDEGTAEIYDLEMAYRFLEELGPGDHRYLISETLRHLHTDGGGNTHRSEVSFDKFWNISFAGGCRGLIEFRALESLPRAEWMSAIALLWQSLAAWLLEEPFRHPLIEHGDTLHDRYFLPSGLITDFAQVLCDLHRAGYPLPREVFDTIIAWRLPVMLESPDGLIVRKALEGWPLLCETPLEGGSTSRFVDTSIERLEISAPASAAESVRVWVQGRELALSPLPDGRHGAGLRYRRTALFPCLHPGIPVQLPLHIVIAHGERREAWRLDADRRHFVEAPIDSAHQQGAPCRRLRENLLTYDLRLT